MKLWKSALLLLLTACHASAVIHPGEIHRLDGYKAGDVVHLRTTAGSEWPFHHRSKITLVLPGNQIVRTWFKEIRIDGDTLRGVDRLGNVTEVRMSDILEFQVHRFSIGRTVTAGVLVVVLSPLVTLVAIGVAAHNNW